MYIPPVFHEAATHDNSFLKPKSGGLLLLRRITPLTRRDAVYFRSGVYTLHHRGVSLLHVERAILLGALRKYAAVRQNGRGTPISSLHYFANLFEEVQQEISTQYWNYVAHKVNTFEQTELWAIPNRTLEK